MTTPNKTKTLRGKYQITKNIFVTCYLDILEATDKEIRTFLSLKKRTDTLVPVGTRIFFDVETINKINVRRQRDFDIFSITVQQLEDWNGKPLHVCTPIQKEARPNLREAERVSAEFPVLLEGGTSEFIARSGTEKGLTLHYTAKKAMLSLALGQQRDFKVTYKGEEYFLNGRVKHIQYDWKRHEHVVGVHFPNLKQEENIILNLLLDPHYTIDISAKQTIDTSAGKISLDD